MGPTFAADATFVYDKVPATAALLKVKVKIHPVLFVYNYFILV
jgi:hypothetical protein